MVPAPQTGDLAGDRFDHRSSSAAADPHRAPPTPKLRAQLASYVTAARSDWHDKSRSSSRGANCMAGRGVLEVTYQLW